MKKLSETVNRSVLLALAFAALLFAAAVGSTSAQPPAPPAGDPFYLALVAEPAELEADGSSTAIINASVWQWDADFEEYLLIWNYPPEITFSTDTGSITPSASYVNGSAEATFTAGTASGTATITATADLDEFGNLTNTTTVTLTTPGGSGGNGGGGGGGGGTTTPTPTASPITSPGVSPAPTATPTGTATPSAAPSGTPGSTGTPTPAPTASATPTTAPTAEPTPKEPGFEALFAITGFLAVAYLLIGRRTR
ncbi:MAG: hypothetical protein JW945_05965 [Methanomicrobia archaeon]|nr:hypothetical protein [Methanomicrobia archaeon]